MASHGLSPSFATIVPPAARRRLAAPRRRRGLRLLFFPVAALPRFTRERLADGLELRRRTAEGRLQRDEIERLARLRVQQPAAVTEKADQIVIEAVKREAEGLD